MTNEEYEIEAASGDLRRIAKAIFIKETTDTFLDNCKKVGISKVSICVAHESVPRSTTFCFGVCGSVFSDDVSYGSWPAIWKACEMSGIGTGCGNGNQHQIDWHKVLEGVYHLIKGKWKKIV